MKDQTLTTNSDELPNPTKYRPSISIGLPVFNGEHYLESALNSLLKQSFHDFELIISDNGSSDSTAAICQSYAAKDQRIRYSRSRSNLGAAWNFNNVFEKSRGKYFMWAAHDDLWSPDYLKRCFIELEANPEFVLCYSATRIIDSDNVMIKEFPANPGLAAAKADKRFASAWRYPPHIPVFGLIRANVLRKTHLIGNYPSSDKTLVAELALFGPFCGIDDYLFYYRRHEQQSTGTNYSTRRSRRAWFDPNKANSPSFPMLRLLTEYAKIIYRAPLELNERVGCFASLSRWIVRNRNNILG